MKVNICVKSIALFSLIFLLGCSTAPPKNINNVCSMYDEYYDWYIASDEVYEKWRIPQHVTMSFLP